MYTTRQVSERIGVSERVIQKYCVVLGFDKFGRDWALTEAQVEQIQNWISTHPAGRPKKGD